LDSSKRLAVVIYNLGGPDSEKAIKPFLFNLFYDPAILLIPNPFRWLVAKIISLTRAPTTKKIYEYVGGKSTILPATIEQAKAIKKEIENLSKELEVFIFMRYWKPDVSDVLKEIVDFNPDEIILVPLYPQFSSTTTGTSIKAFQDEAKKIGLQVPHKVICCYPTHKGFLEATVENIGNLLKRAKKFGSPRLLISAHGLPQRTIKLGDPYKWQVEKTSRAIIEALDDRDLDWVTCYQSRVGPVKWIEPYTEQELLRAGQDKVPVVIAPISFVSEHIETLVEIDIEYRHLAEKAGVPFFDRTPALAINSTFIKGISELIQRSLEDDSLVISQNSKRICPMEFGQCPLVSLDK